MTRASLRLVAIIILGLAVVSGPTAQDLSTLVFPSEDEIQQAFELGGIDYARYIRLLELAHTGVTPHTTYLLDDVPNLVSVGSDSTVDATSLQNEQAAAFRSDPTLTGFVSYRMTQEAEDHGRSRYRSTGDFRIGEHWRIVSRVNREYTGRERVVYRSAEYTAESGFIRSLRLGSFSARYGLGTAIGYGGKLLSSSDRLDTESLLFPDYGGYNGMEISVGRGTLVLNALASIRRDSQYSHVTSAARLTHRGISTYPEIVLALNALRRRSTGESVSDVKLAMSNEYVYDRGRVAHELVLQSGIDQAYGVVVEGKHRSSRVRFSYAAWMYDREFISWTTGSKSGGLRFYRTLDDIAWRYREDRGGQKGLLVRSTIDFARAWQSVVALRVGYLNADTSNAEWLAGVIWQCSRSLSWRADVLIRDRTRLEATDSIYYDFRRIRLESRIGTGNWRLRGYIAHTQDSKREDYGSLFLSMVAETSRWGRLEIWSDMGRIVHSRLDYWYGYLRNEQCLFESVRAGVKITHRYNRNAGTTYLTTVSLEVRALIQ